MYTLTKLLLAYNLLLVDIFFANRTAITHFYIDIFLPSRYILIRDNMKVKMEFASNDIFYNRIP